MPRTRCRACPPRSTRFGPVRVVLRSVATVGQRHHGRFHDFNPIGGCNMIHVRARALPLILPSPCERTHGRAWNAGWCMRSQAWARVSGYERAHGLQDQQKSPLQTCQVPAKGDSPLRVSGAGACTEPCGMPPTGIVMDEPRDFCNAPKMGCECPSPEIETTGDTLGRVGQRHDAWPLVARVAGRNTWPHGGPRAICQYGRQTYIIGHVNRYLV
jgi:hypothetical protein